MDERNAWKQMNVDELVDIILASSQGPGTGRQVESPAENAAEFVDAAPPRTKKEAAQTETIGQARPQRRASRQQSHAK